MKVKEVKISSKKWNEIKESKCKYFSMHKNNDLFKSLYCDDIIIFLSDSNNDDYLKTKITSIEKEEITFKIIDKNVNFKNAKFLLDTNIIIQRESYNNCSADIINFFKIIDKLNGKKYYHPMTISELNKYENLQIKNNILKKLNAYEKLTKTNQVPNEFFQKKTNEGKQNDNISNDNLLLREVFDGNVDFLIT